MYAAQIFKADSCLPQAGLVNFAYLKFGPLARGPTPTSPPLIMVLGFGQTLHTAPLQLMRHLAEHRRVRAHATPWMLLQAQLLCKLDFLWIILGRRISGSSDGLDTLFLLDHANLCHWPFPSSHRPLPDTAACHVSRIPLPGVL